MATDSIAMIPARLGSQRLVRKNLQTLATMSLIEAAVTRCLESEAFDDVWVSSESQEILDLAEKAGANTHVRPDRLANNIATSEDFVADFLDSHPCNSLFQVHSIAPLIAPSRIRQFRDWFISEGFDTGLCVDRISLETLYQEQPVNFSYARKENSQDLEPLVRINWAMTAWSSKSFLDSSRGGAGGAYSGQLGYFTLDQVECLVIKDEMDLQIARAILTVPPFSSIPH